MDAMCVGWRESTIGNRESTPGDDRSHYLAAIANASRFALCISSGNSYASERLPRLQNKRKLIFNSTVEHGCPQRVVEVSAVSNELRQATPVESNTGGRATALIESTMIAA
jgi:hypothetical protein